MLTANHDATQSFAFNGWVQRGESFSKELPNGLLFDLRGGDCGWWINIHPPDDYTVDYVGPENPPVRYKNELFFDDEYDGDWESPLRHVHTIYFLLRA